MLVSICGLPETQANQTREEFIARLKIAIAGINNLSVTVNDITVMITPDLAQQRNVTTRGRTITVQVHRIINTILVSETVIAMLQTKCQRFLRQYYRQPKQIIWFEPTFIQPPNVRRQKKP